MNSHAPLARLLETRKRTALSDGEAIRCAVLVPLIADGDGYSVLYTLRSDHVPNHQGQVSFPGGKHSEGDRDLADTALREANEEVGIDPGEVEVIGCLDDVYTLAARFVITPFVGILPATAQFTVNPGEVADLFTVAVEALLDPVHHGVETRSWDGNDFEIQVITAGRHIIWGATHTITTNLIDCLSANAPETPSRQAR